MKKCLICAGYECKKFLWAQKGVLVAGLCLLLHFLFCAFTKPEYSVFLTNASMYRNYVQRYSGEYSKATAEKIAAEIEKQTEIASAESQGTEQMMAEVKIPILEKIQEKYASLEPLQQFGAILVYDLEFTSYAKKAQLDWMALLVVTVFSVGVFFGDFRCGMEQLLIPSKMGRKRILRGKAAAVVVLSGITAAVFYFLQLAYFQKKWRLGDLSAPMQSFSGFEDCTLPFRMQDALLLAGGLKILATMVFALFLAFFTLFFRNEILAVAVTAALTGCGVFLGNAGGSFLLLTPLRGITGLMAATPMLLIVETTVLMAEAVVLYFLICGRLSEK